MSETVCVTGASGFLGSHIVRELLEHRFRVLALVRNLHTPACAALREIQESIPGSEIDIREADILEPNSYSHPFSQCSYVIHTAAQVRDNTKVRSSAYQQVLDVNIRGTQNLLSSIEGAGTIKKLVFTSSMAAVLRHDKPADYRFSESDWNTEPLEASDAYWFSKTAAEQLLARKFEEFKAANGPKLVCINPSVIIGPAYSQQHTRTSISIIKDLHEGKIPGCPNLYFSFVDVRDLAALHVRAILDRDAEGRFLAPGTSTSMRELSCMIKHAFPASKAPQRTIPDVLMYLSAPFNRKVSFRYLRDHLGVEHRFDDAKVKAQFNLEYRPLEASVIDTVRSFDKLRY